MMAIKEEHALKTEGIQDRLVEYNVINHVLKHVALPKSMAKVGPKACTAGSVNWSAMPNAMATVLANLGRPQVYRKDMCRFETITHAYRFSELVTT